MGPIVILENILLRSETVQSKESFVAIVNQDQQTNNCDYSHDLYTINMNEFLKMTSPTAAKPIQDCHIDLTMIDDDLMPATSIKINEEQKKSVKVPMKKKKLIEPLIISRPSTSGPYEVKSKTSLLSFQPVQEYIAKKKFSKQRIIDAKLAVHRYEKMDTCIRGKINETHKIRDKIVSLELEISGLQKESANLQKEIELNHIPNTECLQQAEMELQQSVNEYEAIRIVHKQWREELDKAFESDEE